MTLIFALIDKLPDKWASLIKKVWIGSLAIGFSLLAIIFAYATLKQLLLKDFTLAAMFFLVLLIFLGALASLVHFHRKPRD